MPEPESKVILRYAMVATIILVLAAIAVVILAAIVGYAAQRAEAWLPYAPPVILAIASCVVGFLGFTREGTAWLARVSVIVCYLLTIGYLAWSIVRLVTDMIANPPDWHAIFVTDWYVTLAIVYLPMMGLAWFAYHRLSAKK